MSRYYEIIRYYTEVQQRIRDNDLETCISEGEDTVMDDSYEKKFSLYLNLNFKERVIKAYSGHSVYSNFGMSYIGRLIPEGYFAHSGSG